MASPFSPHSTSFLLCSDLAGDASNRTTLWPRPTVIHPTTSQHAQTLAVQPQHQTALRCAEPKGSLSLPFAPSPPRGCPPRLGVGDTVLSCCLTHTCRGKMRQVIRAGDTAAGGPADPETISPGYLGLLSKEYTELI